MAYSLETKRKALRLRKRGYSLNEIVERLGISKSTVSFWMLDVAMGASAEARLLMKIKKGQLLSGRARHAAVKNLEREYLEEARREYSAGDCFYQFRSESGRDVLEVVAVVYAFGRG